MSVPTAKIIDLDERRRARHAAQGMQHGNDPAFLPPPLFAMTWVPVWFVPVFFADSSAKFG